MTAPLFNLPIAPVAGAAPQNAAQGAAAGFEALLAAFFGAPGENVEGALSAAAVDTDRDDEAPAVDDPNAAPADPTALPTDALGLASVLLVQQPQQVATTANEVTEETGEPNAAAG